MTTQITVLAAEFAALPAEVAGAIREPSSWTVLMIGLTGLLLGRLMSAGRRSASQD